MAEFEPIIKALGPTGALLVLAMLGARGVWPYLRDTHLPALAAARKEQATAFTNIADLTRGIDQRLSTVETTTGRIEQAVSTNSRDLAVLTTIYARRPATPAEVAATLERR